MIRTISRGSERERERAVLMRVSSSRIIRDIIHREKKKSKKKRKKKKKKKSVVSRL